MFYNYHKLAKQSLIPQNRYLSLPIQSYKKSNQKYKTPYKRSNSTNVTRNNTLSFNSLLTKNKSTIASKKTSKKQQPLLFSQQRSKKNKFSKNDMATIDEKKSRKSSENTKKGAKYQKCKQQMHQTNKIITNTQFYRSSRGKSPGTDITLQYMGKISKIFDLVNENQKIPLQIQVFLNWPLARLRQRFKRYKKRQIAESLISFKNNCMDIFRKSPSKQIALFLRLALPQSNRWQVSDRNKLSKQQNERAMRQRYFKSLKIKEFQQRPENLYQLKRIQDRLDAFLERSFNKSFDNRRVYI